VATPIPGRAMGDGCRVALSTPASVSVTLVIAAPGRRRRRSGAR
jgi:hypothetical protein